MIVQCTSEKNENSTTHCAAASDFTTNYCNIKDQLKASYHPFIWPHQQVTVVQIVLHKSRSGKWKALQRRPIWQQMQQLNIAACAFSPSVYDRLGLTSSQINT